MDFNCLHCAYGYDEHKELFCNAGPSRSPLCWPGGKYSIAAKLVALFPEHTCYVEPFGGAGHVLFKKPSSKSEVYNDLDGRLVNFFRVVQDERRVVALCRMLLRGLYSRELFNECMAGLQDASLSDVQRAFCFAIVNKQSFGGIMETWGVDIKAGKTAQTYFNLPKLIRRAHERLRGVQIEHSGYEYVLSKYDRPDTFFYCDPPYDFAGERSRHMIYDHEMTTGEHGQLIARLQGLRGKVMLSGYDTPSYVPLVDAGWRKISLGEKVITIKKSSGEKRMTRSEWVWVNW